MPQRPSSPTPLLWAHKLGIEHQHVLSKLKTIESADRQRETRMAETENNNKQMLETVAGWNDLAVRVKLLEEDDSEQKIRFETLDRDRSDRIEKQRERLDAQEAKLRNLEAKYRQWDEVMDQMIEDNAGLVKAMQKLEERVSSLYRVATEKAAVTPDEVKALQARLKILETTKEQDHKASKQQLAASNAALEREAERIKTLEAEKEKLSLETAKLRRGLDDQKSKEGVAQRSRNAAKLPPSTSKAAQHCRVVTRSKPLAGTQRYRSDFNLRGSFIKCGQEPSPAVGRGTHIVPPQPSIIPETVLTEDNVICELTPTLKDKKRKSVDVMEGPITRHKLLKRSVGAQEGQTRISMAERQGVKAEDEGMPSSHRPPPLNQIERKDVLKKGQEAKATRNINGKYFQVRKLVLQEDDANAKSSNVEPAQKLDQVVKVALAQHHQRRPKRDLPMNSPVNLEELEAEFGI